jgi:uncharacterized membrane protein YdbT with pleckstrin-like domain
MNTTASTQGSETEAAERTLWRGTPSQWINLPQYLLWFAVFVALVTIGIIMWRPMQETLPAPVVTGLAVLAFVPLLVIVWKWLVLANTVYELTTQRLRLRSGVINKHLDELELYRVRDYRLQQPFFLRVFSLSNITLTTSDRSHANVTLHAIAGGDAVREQIRTYVEDARRRRGVREVDVE